MLDDLRASCDQVIQTLKEAHGWQDYDFRIVTIHRLRNVIQSSLAVRVFQWVIFPNDNFWKTFFQAVPSSAQMEDLFRELDMMARSAGNEIIGLLRTLANDVAIVRLPPA